MVLVAVLIVAGGLGAFMDSIYDFRTDELSQDFSVSTAVGVTSANVQLSTNLWDGNIAYASVSSNETAEAPVANSYNSTTRQLAINGLTANMTRTISVTYDVAGLEDYEGVDEGVTHFPVVLVVGLIIFSLGTIIAVLYLVVKRHSF